MKNNSIGYYQNAIPSLLCDDVLTYYDTNQQDVFESEIANRNVSGTIKHNKLRVSNELELSPFKSDELYNKLLDAIHIFVQKYIATYPAVYNIIKDGGYERFSIIRYEPGVGHYGYHTDNDGLVISNRVLSVIVYLNDVIEGGETEFAYVDKIIKPSKGDVIVFPSGWTHLHKGNMPISNSKYICVTWFNKKIE